MMFSTLWYNVQMDQATKSIIPYTEVTSANRTVKGINEIILLFELVLMEKLGCSSGICMRCSEGIISF
jgi:hypothetical protein